MAGKAKKAKPATRDRKGGPARAPAEPKLNLLEEPLLGVVLRDGERRSVSLPEALALLGRDTVGAFTAMQAHQRHGWHAFLVQLAAIALHRAGEPNPKQSAAVWRDLLLALTKRSEPWCLVVEDLSRPAFMQPPVPEGSLDAFHEPQRYPDELDVLVTAKNHDVKMSRIAAARPEHWVYALVTLQTMEGFSGRSNYGIARMNGGQASRPVVGLAAGLSAGARFTRDVAVTAEARDEIAKGRGFVRRGGLALLWTEAWDGDKSLDLTELDPLFIDVCRRLRLVEVNGVLAARRAGSETERTDSKVLKGNTGDPWTPVHRAEAKAFTATEAGFSYRVLQRLLGDEFEPGAALRPRERDGDALLLASVLVRGQGKTGGFHERVLPVPREAVEILRRADSRADLGRLAKERVEMVSLVQNRVLRPALKVLLQGGPEKLNQDDDRPDPWVRAHDAEVDALFFERLWVDLGRDPGDAAPEWAREVIALARRQLDAAFDGAPFPVARRYRAIAAAERVFEGAARKHVSIAYPKEEVTHVE